MPRSLWIYIVVYICYYEGFETPKAAVGKKPMIFKVFLQEPLVWSSTVLCLYFAITSPSLVLSAHGWTAPPVENRRAETINKG